MSAPFGRDVSTVTARTRVAAVIGDPVRHSRSPQILNAAFAALGLDWIYVAFPVPRGTAAEAVRSMRTLGIDGLSVTMPHKDTVAEVVDRRTPAVEALGACNCVFRDGDRLVGDNTDGDGFLRALADEADTTVAQRSVAVLGAGGAARAIIDAVGRAGARSIVVINRSEDAAIRAASVAPAASVGVAEQVLEVDVVINATSVGMRGGPDPDHSPLDAGLLRPHHVVADIVYEPLTTPLMTDAAASGARVVGGLGMLVQQAAIAFEHWTGEAAPIDAMRTAAAGD